MVQEWLCLYLHNVAIAACIRIGTDQVYEPCVFPATKGRNITFLSTAFYIIEQPARSHFLVEDVLCGV